MAEEERIAGLNLEDDGYRQAEEATGSDHDEGDGDGGPDESRTDGSE